MQHGQMSTYKRSSRLGKLQARLMYASTDEVFAIEIITKLALTSLSFSL